MIEKIIKCGIYIYSGRDSKILMSHEEEKRIENRILLKCVH